MPALISLVEGEGDKKAVPTLLTKILTDLKQWGWYVGETIAVGSLAKLKKNLAKYLSHAIKKKNCGAILMLLDLDDGCPKEEANQLAEQLRPFNLAQPVAIVFAYREYETWFLASLPTIAGHYNLPANLTYDKEVEAKRAAKEWLDYHMRPKLTYKERIHQAKFTQLLDIELAFEHSRSFRRLYHAIEELVEAVEKGERGVVTPIKEEQES